MRHQVANTKRWRAKNKEHFLEWGRAYQKFRLFGVSTDRYQEMLAKQNGLCAICQKPETVVRQKRLLALAIDHDHVTKKIRGLLCSNCNQGLGRFKDNPSLLIAAAGYLNATL
jgi:hypothetical protein